MPRRSSQVGISDQVVAAFLARAAESRVSGRYRRAPTQPPIRLLIVDSQRIVLLGLEALFGAARNCEVVGHATNADQAVEECRKLQPEVVVMDADLPGGSGVVAAQQIGAQLQGKVRIIMFGSAVEPTLTIAAMHAGVSGYLLKRTDPARLVEAVEAVAGGALFIDDVFTTAVTEWFKAGQPTCDPLARLSQQERRIVRLIAEGRTNRDIAAVLQLSEYTVKTYVSAVLRKLNLTSRAEAAAFVSRRESGHTPS